MEGTMKVLRQHLLLLLLNLWLLQLVTGQVASVTDSFTGKWSVVDRAEENVYGTFSSRSCLRPCSRRASPRTCYFKFHIEFYMTMNDACGDCPRNMTDCFRRQCIGADGYERSVKAVNRQMPGPDIQVCKGDRLVIDVENAMIGEATTIHWHGLLQRDTQYMDGVPMVTQCPIIADTVFRYKFLADSAGTYFWHSHSGLHMLDGVTGALIVRDYQDLSNMNYDLDLSEHYIIIQDWLHEMGNDRFPGRKERDPDQHPVTYLINGMGRFTEAETQETIAMPFKEFRVESGKRYRFRLINAGVLSCPIQLQVEGHRLRLIASDGEDLQPVMVDTIISFSGERYDFVIEANNTPASYWIQVKGLVTCRGRRSHQLAVLRYAGSDGPSTRQPVNYDNEFPVGVLLNPLDGDCATDSRPDAYCSAELTRRARGPLYRQTPDEKLYIPFGFTAFDSAEFFSGKRMDAYLQPNGGSEPLSSTMDGISMRLPSSPLLSQASEISPLDLCNARRKPAECSESEHCYCSHIVDVPLNSLVEIVLVDLVVEANISHPFHLHGHTFEVLAQGRKMRGRISASEVQRMDSLGFMRRRSVRPVMKDTVPVPSNGYTIIRFRADNPGYWLFHCHFAYHAVTGMEMVIRVNGPVPAPPPNFPRCGNFLY